VTAIVRWEEPPRGQERFPSKYQDLADTLRANPGMWAVALEEITRSIANGLCSRSRNGVNPFGPKGSFEMTVVGPESGLVKLYARYVGDVTS
jgi:hypothetical protein